MSPTLTNLKNIHKHLIEQGFTYHKPDIYTSGVYSIHLTIENQKIIAKRINYGK